MDKIMNAIEKLSGDLVGVRENIATTLEIIAE